MKCDGISKGGKYVNNCKFRCDDGKRKKSSRKLASKIGITQANLSILKINKGKSIRFTTLEKICEVLDCKPGDILDYRKEGKNNE